MSDFSELQSQPLAISYLSEQLRKGTLTLFLGAGSSKGFGLPDWLELVNSLRRDSSLSEFPKGTIADTLQHGVDEVRDKLPKDKDQTLINLIRQHLYPTPGELIMTDVFSNHLLIAVSALLMGSKRGHVTRVVTLNYDNMLEWFLSIFGFSVKTIYQLPELEGSEDVRIYHPHGFIPNPTVSNDVSNFVILGMQSANMRLATPGEPWFEMLRHLLNTGVCLFLGMSPNSLSDRAISPLFAATGSARGGKSPLGVWISMDKLDSSKIAEFQRNSIVPLHIDEPKKISQFLLDICQDAIKHTS